MPMSRLLICLLLLSLVVGLVGCKALQPADAAGPVGTTGGKSAAGGDQPSGTLLVFVPCGMAGPFGEIKKLFQERYPQVDMELDLRNVDVQSAAIEDGKDHPDAWLCLGDVEMARAVAADRIEDAPVTFAYNSLALIVAKGNPCDVRSPEDLLNESVRTVALPSERNSSGYYAARAFQAQGIWEDLEPKVWSTDEPALVKKQLGTGKADVGLIYYPCAKEAKRVGGPQEELPTPVEMLGKIDEELTGQIPCQAAVVKGSENPELGRLFVEFLLEPASQRIWEDWDFAPAHATDTEVSDATLHLYCGAGIRPFAESAMDAFTAAHPGVVIEASYAGSGCLLSQLTFAKRGDLYMPGEDFYLNQAMERGFISESELVGYFEPVILVAEGNPLGIQGVQDLLRDDVKVGIGEPEMAAVGRTTRDLLQAAGMYDQVAARVAMHAGTVPELGNSVQLGSLDAAVVWNVTAAQIADETDAIEMPRELWEPATIRIGVLEFSEAAETARAFIEFCASEEGQALVAKSGIKPKETDTAS